MSESRTFCKHYTKTACRKLSELRSMIGEIILLFLCRCQMVLEIDSKYRYGVAKSHPMFLPMEVSKETISQPHHVLSTDCVRGYNEHLISPYEIPRVVPEYPF